MQQYLIKLLILLLLLAGTSLADDEAHIEKLETSISLLKSYHGDILFPQAFAQLSGEIEAFKKRSSAADYAKTDAEFVQLINDLQSWIATARRTQSNLINLLDIRENAVTVDAADFAAIPFQKGEYYLALAADDDLRNPNAEVNKNARRARQFYVQSEHQAIKNHILGEAKIFIQEASALKAEQLTPVTLARTRQLLTEVESLLKLKPAGNQTLTRKSQQLQQASRHLLQLVQTIHPIYQNNQNAESFFLETESVMSELGKSLGAPLQPRQDLKSALQDLQSSAKHLRLENDRLRARTEQLEAARQELENELARYRSIAAENGYIQRKISRLKNKFGDIISLQNDRLSIRLNRFRFKETSDELEALHKNLLLDVVEILHEFPGNAVTLQYHQLSTGSQEFSQNLAGHRLEKVRTFIVSKFITVPPPPLQWSASVSNADLEPADSESFLDITVDLKTYLSFKDSTGAKSE